MSDKKSLVIFASGEGSHLQNFIDAQENLDFKIVALVCNNPKAKAIDKAKQAQIDLIVINHQDFDNRQNFEQSILKHLANYQFDLILLAGFMRFLSHYFINSIAVPIFNIHPSLLPKYKGLNTHNQVLKSKDRYHGASVHLVNNQLDSGFVIKQIKIPITGFDNDQTLQKRLLNYEHQLYLEVVHWFCLNRLKIKINHDGKEKVYLDNQLIQLPIIQICD